MAQLRLKFQGIDEVSPIIKKLDAQMLKLNEDTHKISTSLALLKADKRGLLSGAIDSDIAKVKELQTKIRNLQNQKNNVDINNSISSITKPIINDKGEVTSSVAHQRMIAREANRIKKAQYAQEIKDYKILLERELKAEEVKLSQQIKANKQAYNTIAKDRESHNKAITDNFNRIQASRLKEVELIKKAKIEQHKLNSRVSIMNDNLVHAIRQISTIYYGLKSLNFVFMQTVGAGIEYNKTMEDISITMQTIVASTSENLKIQKDGSKVPITVAEKWAIAKEEVKGLTKAIKDLNAETPTTLTETSKIFSTLLPQARASKATYNEILKLTKLMSIASVSGRIAPDELKASLDGLVQGSFKANSEMGVYLQTLGITNKELKAFGANSHKSIDYLLKKLGVLAPAGKEIAQSMTGTLNRFQNAYSTMVGEGTKNLFDAIKDNLNSITLLMDTEGTNIAKSMSESIGSALNFLYEAGITIKAIFEETTSVISSAFDDMVLALEGTGLVEWFRELNESVGESDNLISQHTTTIAQFFALTAGYVAGSKLLLFFRKMLAIFGKTRLAIASLGVMFTNSMVDMGEETSTLEKINRYMDLASLGIENFGKALSITVNFVKYYVSKIVGSFDYLSAKIKLKMLELKRSFELGANYAKQLFSGKAFTSYGLQFDSTTSSDAEIKKLEAVAKKKKEIFLEEDAIRRKSFELSKNIALADLKNVKDMKATLEGTALNNRTLDNDSAYKNVTINTKIDDATFKTVLNSLEVELDRLTKKFAGNTKLLTKLDEEYTKTKKRLTQEHARYHRLDKAEYDKVIKSALVAKKLKEEEDKKAKAKADKKAKELKREADKKAKELKAFNDYYLKNTLDTYTIVDALNDKRRKKDLNWDRYALAEKFENFRKQGMDKLKLSKLWAIEIAKIEKKERKLNNVWFNGDAKKGFSDAKEAFDRAKKDRDLAKKELERRAKEHKAWLTMIGDVDSRFSSVFNTLGDMAEKLTIDIGTILDSNKKGLEAFKDLQIDGKDVTSLFGDLEKAFGVKNTNTSKYSQKGESYGSVAGSVVGAMFGNSKGGEKVGSLTGAILGGVYGGLKGKKEILREGIFIDGYFDTIKSIQDNIDKISNFERSKKSYIFKSTNKKTMYTDLKQFEIDNLEDAIEQMNESISDTYRYYAQPLIHASKDGFVNLTEMMAESMLLNTAEGLRYVWQNMDTPRLLDSDLNLIKDKWQEYADSIQQDVNEVIVSVLATHNQVVKDFKRHEALGIGDLAGQIAVAQIDLNDAMQKVESAKSKDDRFGDLTYENIRDKSGAFYNELVANGDATTIKQLDELYISLMRQKDAERELAKLRESSADATNKESDAIKNNLEAVKKAMNERLKELNLSKLIADEQESANNRDYKAMKERVTQVNDFFLGSDSYMNSKQKTEYAKELYTKSFNAGDTQSAMKYGQDYLGLLNMTSRDGVEIRRKQEEYKARFGGEIYAQEVVDKESVKELKQLQEDVISLKAVNNDMMDFFNSVRGLNGSSIQVSS